MNNNTYLSNSGSQPPEHLSEFLSLMNSNNAKGNGTGSGGSIALFKQRDGPGSDRIPGKSVVRRTSLTTIDTFTSFSPSVLDLPNILTSKDFEKTISSYENLLTKAQKLQEALDLVTHATNEFGQALEDTINENPKVNNLKIVSDGMNNAGGLQYMISTNQQILGRLLKQSFETPLKKELSNLQQSYQENHLYYQQEIRSRSRILREKELKNIQLSKLKTRSLSDYKNNLAELTKQVEEIDRLKYGYFHEINLMLERFNSDHLLTRTGSLVRAQLEIYEGIAKKGWSGGGLDDLLSVSPDLFAENDDSSAKSTELTNNDTLDFIDRLDDVDTEGLEAIGTDEDAEYDEANQTVLNIQTEKETDDIVDRFAHLAGRSTPLPSEEEQADNGLGNDESFSLPVVNNSNSLVGKTKEKRDEEIDENLSRENILGEL